MEFLGFLKITIIQQALFWFDRYIRFSKYLESRLRFLVQVSEKSRFLVGFGFGYLP